MKLEMAFIGALLFGLVFVAGLNLYGEGLSKYNKDIDTSSTFGKMSYNLQGVYDFQQDSKDKLQGGIVTDESAVDEMVKGGYTGIRANPFFAMSVAANATQTLAQETGYVSPEILGWAMAVLSILIVFSIMALVFRFRSN
jgi:hypothetical protein